jgi:hypothetical protein
VCLLLTDSRSGRGAAPQASVRLAQSPPGLSRLSKANQQRISRVALDRGVSKENRLHTRRFALTVVKACRADAMLQPVLVVKGREFLKRGASDLGSRNTCLLTSEPTHQNARQSGAKVAAVQGGFLTPSVVRKSPIVDSHRR